MESEFQNDNEIDLGNIFQVMWNNKISILFATILCLILGTIYAKMLPIKYEAKIIVAPTDNQGVAGMMQQIGGLAALAGISSVGGGVSELRKHINIVKSLAFLQFFVKENNLLPVVYSNCWNKELKSWVALCKETPPTILDAARTIRNGWFDINNNSKTGLITIGLKHQDPVFAAEITNKFVKDANRFLRKRYLMDIDKNIAFLKSEAAKTNELEVREILYRVLEQEIKKQKLDGSREHFAFEIIDPAYPSKIPYSPKKKQIVLLSIVLGGMIGMAIVVLKGFLGNAVRTKSS